MAGERRVSICEFTTLTASFEEDLAAYSAAGARGIGICEFKLSEGDAFGDALPRSIWALPADEAARRAVASVERLWAAEP